MLLCTSVYVFKHTYTNIIFFYFQTQSLKTFVVKALTDTILEGEEHFSVHLFPAKSDVVIDPLNGQYYFLSLI